MARQAWQVQGPVQLLLPEQSAAKDAPSTAAEDVDARYMLQDSCEEEEAVTDEDDERAAVVAREQRLMRT